MARIVYCCASPDRPPSFALILHVSSRPLRRAVAVDFGPAKSIIVAESVIANATGTGAREREFTSPLLDPLSVTRASAQTRVARPRVRARYSGQAVSAGRAYLFSGRDGGRLKTFTCRIPGDTFGFDAVGMGDIDGDGTIDFLITSAWSGIHGFHSGRMFIVSGGIRRGVH